MIIFNTNQKKSNMLKKRFFYFIGPTACLEGVLNLGLLWNQSLYNDNPQS